MSLDLSSVATRLLGKLASNADGYIQLVRESGGDVDDITGDHTGGSEATFNLIGAVTEIKSTLIDGSRVQAGDVMVTVDNQVEPQLSDKLYIGGVLHQIVSPITTVNHAGIVQVYRIQARK